MQFKLFAAASLASLAAAQSNQTLTQALNSTSDLSNLTALLTQADLVTTLGTLSNITILAPNNDAITEFLSNANASNDTAALQALLQYHVLNGTYLDFNDTTFVPTLLSAAPYDTLTGGQVVEVVNTTVFSGLRANSSIVSESPVNFTGGVVHIIDTVLTLPTTVSEAALAFGLTSFYGAASNASLVEAVDSTPDLTVFVPNNEAFQSIGSALPNLTTEELASILSYHVINGTVAYSSLLSNESVGTLNGTNVTITVIDGDVFVNNALVVIPDILVANGVVHVIDEVLNPGNATASAGDDSGEPAFGGATSATEPPFTSSVPAATTTVDTTSAAAGATATSSSSSAGAWMPGPTGAFGAALGGLALIMQL